MNRYTVTVADTKQRSTCLAATAIDAATRARDARESTLRFLAPGRRSTSPCEAVAVNDTDPTDTATVRFGR